VERKTKKKEEDVFTAREKLTCHYNETRWLGWKGRFTRKVKVQGNLSEWKVYYPLSVLLPNSGCQPFCISCVCIDYLKKFK